MSLAESVKTNLQSITIEGQPLSIPQISAVVDGSHMVRLSADEAIHNKIAESVSLVQKAVAEGWSVYGVTTGFGGMADVPVPLEQASASQNNLLSFLATGAGEPINVRHTRAAMLLRANVLMQGCSGVRLELIQRMVDFLNHDAIPVVCELGSIGASGDLVPLSAIARAITGHDPNAKVQQGETTYCCSEILERLNLSPIKLEPKEGLSLINGTSFSAAIAANCVAEVEPLVGLSLAINAMMMTALDAQRQPFESFVHQHKPHPGQLWTAKQLRRLLSHDNTNDEKTVKKVQDRYSIRCYPQYFGSVIEGVARIGQTVETEMNSISDNPLVASEEGCFYQSGN